MTRRRLLPLLATTPFYYGCGEKVAETIWKGVLFHNPVSIRYHSDRSLNKAITAEVRKLELILSLYEPSSELALLNSTGSSSSPSNELLEILAKCSSLHRLSKGLFDPTVQSYWSWLSERNRLGNEPTEVERVQARRKVDFARVGISPSRVELNGTQLTLNAVAQGFATDRLALFLKSQGVHSALVNLGEYRAIGGPFEIEIRHPSATKRVLQSFSLQSRSLAVSSGSGHRLSAAGKDNHLLSPLSGQSPPALRTVVVSAPDATTADAWATIVSLELELITALPAGVEAQVY
ncbi:MAG: FAD:protein FMN transferase [Roseibacillus sp.]